MEKRYFTSNQIYELLIKNGIIGAHGIINFNLKGTSINIKTTDSVGITLQLWLGKFMSENNICFREAKNTQVFPDYKLSPEDDKQLLEIKAFNYNSSPNFDIANFNSYCDSLIEKPYNLDADYLIFGYTMNNSKVTIEDLWLKKIWEISGKSQKWPLRLQVKRGMIYNIRPVKWYSKHAKSTNPFKNKKEFIDAIYQTLLQYSQTKNNYKNWKRDFIRKYTS